MIMDERLEFSDGGDFATETGTSNVGDVIDLGPNSRDIGEGQAMYLVINVETAADGGAGAAGTTQFRLVSDSTSTPATDGTPTVHLLTDAYTASQLPQGRVFVFPLPSGGAQAYERYLGLQIVQGSEGEDDLVCSAFLTFDPHGWKAYPDGSN